MERWAPLAPYADIAQNLCAQFSREIVGDDLMKKYGKQLDWYCKLRMPRWFNEDVDALSKILGVPKRELQIANMYYDGIKLVMAGTQLPFGCTAFAASDGNGGVWHARNLDWFCEDDVLSRGSIILNFRKRNNLKYRAVTWPGFIGILSGMAPGKFSVTLNAVLSDKKPSYTGWPVGILIREVLQSCWTYNEAVDKLLNKRIIGDALLMVTGVKPKEQCVVERIPSYGEVRKPHLFSDAMVVTNDYRQLPDGEAAGGELAASTCRRYDRTRDLLIGADIESGEDCMDLLADPDIMMGITAQQMAFNCRTGKIAARAV
jgi:hypothetical protein